MTNTTQFNNDILKTLSPEERELALSILNDLSTGDSRSYEDLKYAEYKEVPVDFLTFIDDDRYLGKAWKDANGKSKMYPYWRKKLCELFPDNLTTAVNNAIFSGARGLGKMNPLDTPVLTSEGFIPMGEVKVGTLVYGRDGKLHKVLQIFPHGYQDIYKVVMSDGTSSECGLEHLWQVTDHHTFREHRYCAPEIHVVDTKYLLGIDFNHSKNRFSIPMCEPIEFNHKDTFIEPYIMGLLLGDGYLGDKGVNLTSADNAILEAFSKYVEKSSGGSYHVVKISGESKSKSQCYRISKVDITHRSRNIYLEEAGRLDLLNKKSHNKFIPKDYLYNDINSRVDLLQGLMDTDGTVVKSKRRDGKGYCYNLNYSTTSKQLKGSFIWLVQSLGGTAKAVKRKSHYKNSCGQIIECKDHYRISLRLPSNIKPFRLERKLLLYNQYTHHNPSRYIVSVEKIPEQKEAQCIYIEGDEHLYLVNDFIVTHNTENAIAAALYLMHRVMCLKDPLAHFHLKTTDTVVFAFMNITQKLSEEIGITKLQNTVKLSPWFMERGRMVGRTNPLWEPPEPIRVVVGSQAKDVIGQAVMFGFCLDGDTTIVTTEGDFKIADLVDKPIHVFNVGKTGDITVSNECSVKCTGEFWEEFHITLADGSILKCTPDHKFMLFDGTYKQAKDLTVDDDILTFKPFGYVYKLTNKLDGKIYIGKRQKTFFDIHYWGSGKYVRHAIKKYGIQSFTREILCWCSTREELCVKERFYIEQYNCLDPTVGYNIAPGGEGGGAPHTLEWRLKHSGEGNGRYHKPVSKETREKISKANKGKVRSTEFKQKLSAATRGKKKPVGFGAKISAAQRGRERSDIELQHHQIGVLKTADKNRGKQVFNNGEKEIRIKPGDNIPAGFQRGRLPSFSVKAKEQSHLPRNYKWFNNDEEERYAAEMPEGWFRGRLGRKGVTQRENNKD